MMVEKGGPNKPEPKPLSLKRQVTAVAVLDLSTRFQDPGMPSSKLQVTVAGFLERVRSFGIPVFFTVSLRDKGTPLGEVVSSFRLKLTQDKV